jgi:hypothetical protein
VHAEGRVVGELDVTVDLHTGFPLLVRDVAVFPPTGGKAVAREIRVSNVVVDAPVTPDAFVPTFPPGTPPASSFDRGYSRVAQGEVAGIVGYQPLLPERVPTGFKLAEIAVAPAGAPTGSAMPPGNPPSRNVVSIAFQRGFDRFVVSTRQTGPDRSRWSDPFAADDPRSGGEAEPITVSTGALAGATGELVIGAAAGPHVWAVDDELMATVSGDLTRGELLEILNSLRPAA